MNVRKWFRIIEAVINYIPYINNGEERLVEYHLVRIVLVSLSPEPVTSTS